MIMSLSQLRHLADNIAQLALFAAFKLFSLIFDTRNTNPLVRSLFRVLNEHASIASGRGGSFGALKPDTREAARPGRARSKWQ